LSESCGSRIITELLPKFVNILWDAYEFIVENVPYADFPKATGSETEYRVLFAH
jgi:hypothetical protein